MAENIQIKINAAVESAQAAQTIGQLRKSLVDLQKLAEESDLGSEKFKELQQQIVSTNQTLAAARDRVGDIQDRISTLEGTPVERLSSSFGLLRDAIFNLDFDKAKIGVEGLVNSMTPLGPDGLPLKGLKAIGPVLKNLGAGVVSLGQTFLQLGKALLTNPIFLLAAVIATIAVGLVALLNRLGLLKPILDAIGSAVTFVTDAFNSFTEAIGLNTAASENNLKKIVEAEEGKRDAIEKTLATQNRVATSLAGLGSREIEMINKITGLRVASDGSINTSRLELQKKLAASYQLELKATEDLIKRKGKLNADEKKSYDELVEKANDANTKIVEITAQRYRRIKDQQTANDLESISFETNEVVRAQKLREKRLEIANQENLVKISLLQENQKLEEKLKLSFDATERTRIQKQIEINRSDIKSETDKTALLRLRAEKEYLDEVSKLNKEALEKRNQQRDNEIKRLRESVLAQIEVEETKIKNLQLNNATEDELTKARIKLIEFETLKKLESVKLSTGEEVNLFFEGEQKKTKIQTFETDQRLKIKSEEDKLTERRLSLEERLQAATKLRSELELAENQGNILVLEKIIRAKLEEARINEQIAIAAERAALGTDREVDAKEKLNVAIKERQELEIQQQSLARELADFEIDNQRRILQTRLDVLQIIKDNNLSVSQEVLEDADKTEKLLLDLRTKGFSSLAKLNDESVETRLKNSEKIKNAELDLLKFNFEEQQVALANLRELGVFAEDLQNVSLVNTQQYNAERLAIEKRFQEEVRSEIQLTEDERISLVSGALFQISELSDALFDIAINNNKKGLQEEEKLAKKKFEVNKALQLGLAVVEGYRAITSSLVASPLTILGVPSPGGIASLAFAISTSAVNIAKIIATKYRSVGSAPSVGSPNIPSTSSGDSPAQAAQFTAPTFFGLGGQQTQVTPGPNQQRVYVVENDITSVQNRVAVIENRALIE